MFGNRLFRLIKTAYRINTRSVSIKVRNSTPVTLGLLSTVLCEEKHNEVDLSWDAESLEHEFLIRQATTVNINAATQLLTVTLVAIQDTSER